VINSVAINGSPRMEKGNTALLLDPFVRGMEEAGAAVELSYASRMDIKPCACGQMYCWYRVPGECCFKDDMQSLYPRLKQSDILILATPVYTPLPGGMQDLINRLCPLLDPFLETRQGRTRARFRKDVAIQKIVLVSAGGWWEKENMDTVVRIAQELAEAAGVEFAGAVLRPHAFLMKQGGELTAEGRAVQEAARRAGYELVQEGAMRQDTLDAVSRPLISQEELRQMYNQWVQP
jgi:multimeric flavodoxin WrbA